MKKIIPIILLGFIAIFFASCGGETKANNNPNAACHTILVPQPLATSVVAKEDIVHTGQSVNGAVKDHAKEFPGYTKEMFLSDNPEIAVRPVIVKKDPCDSTKVKYTSIPLYSGDVILLRLPFRIDTIAGYMESIVWKSAHPSSHIKKIIDIDDKGRVIVENQNISCDGAYVNPGPPQKGDGTLPPDIILNPTNPGPGDTNGNITTSGSDTPWWVWVMLILLLIAMYMIWQNKKADPNSVGNITEAVREEGYKTRNHVTAALDGLGGKMDNQTNATNTTNQLLRKWLEQNPPK